MRSGKRKKKTRERPVWRRDLREQLQRRIAQCCLRSVLLDDLAATIAINIANSENSKARIATLCADELARLRSNVEPRDAFGAECHQRPRRIRKIFDTHHSFRRHGRKCIECRCFRPLPHAVIQPNFMRRVLFQHDDVSIAITIDVDDEHLPRGTRVERQSLVRAERAKRSICVVTQKFIEASAVYEEKIEIAIVIEIGKRAIDRRCAAATHLHFSRCIAVGAVVFRHQADVRAIAAEVEIRARVVVDVPYKQRVHRSHRRCGMRAIKRECAAIVRKQHRVRRKIRSLIRKRAQKNEILQSIEIQIHRHCVRSRIATPTQFRRAFILDDERFRCCEERIDIFLR